MTDEELLSTLGTMQALMVSVATGGERLATVHSRFRNLHSEAATGLSARAIDIALPDDDLWAWYGRWSAGDLPTYQSRRDHVRKLFAPLVAAVRGLSAPGRAFEPTGWERVDRALRHARDALARGANAEDFQAVGLLCREALISVAEAVWRADRHPTHDGVKPSSTDAKRRLDAFVAVELAGNANEDARRHVRSAYDLAAALQHKRAAEWQAAALCVEATASIASLMAILAGRKAPSAS